MPNGHNEPIGYNPPSEPPPLLGENQLRDLCRQGWLSLDLPQHITNELNRVFVASTTFFDRDIDEKVGLYPPSRGTESGYYRVSVEKEYVTLRRSNGIGDVDIERHACNAWNLVFGLLHRILCDLTRVGGIPSSAWDKLIAQSLTYPVHDANLNDVTTLVRLFRYFPEGGSADPHTDLGLLTLCLGDAPGLQVQAPGFKHEWIDASRPTILVGETLHALSQRGIPAGRHRVMSSPSGRHSVVFALRPNLTGHVDLSVFGGQGIMQTRKLYTDIQSTKYNINAQRDLREQQRQAQRDKLPIPSELASSPIPCGIARTPQEN